MDIKDIKAHYRAEEEELEVLPWFIRIPVKIGEFLRYKVWGYVEDFPREFKWEWQRLFRGYADCDVWDVGSFIINKIHAPLKEFARREEEEGMSLPAEFETDPAAWLEIVKKIEFSIDHAWKEENDMDYYPTKNMGIDEEREFYEHVDEGFLLFGKYLRNLWD
jgi:hypothetical protein